MKSLIGHFIKELSRWQVTEASESQKANSYTQSKTGAPVNVSLPGMKQWIQIESPLLQIDNPAACGFLIQIGVVHQPGS